MRPRLVSYIERNRARLEQRHYVADAFTDTMWFYFAQNRIRFYVDAYVSEFCLIVNASPSFDHAFILPFKDFKDFFSQELLDENARWVCNIPAKGEVIRLSYFNTSIERPVSRYHNAFKLLQDSPKYFDSAPDIDSMI